MSPFFLSSCFFYSRDLFLSGVILRGILFCFTRILFYWILLYSEGERLGFRVALFPPHLFYIVFLVISPFHYNCTVPSFFSCLSVSSLGVSLLDSP